MHFRFCSGPVSMARLGVASLVCLFTVVWAQPGTLHIDCGAPQGYRDPLGVKWENDAAYIGTGEVGTTKEWVRYWNLWPELQYNRFFPDSSRAKHCYTLPVTPQQTYMLRAEFMFGNYASPPFPSFHLSLDASVVENVTIPSAYFDVIREITFAAGRREAVAFCLVRESGVPFINSISLRAVENLPPVVVAWLGRNQSVSTMNRVYFNGTALKIWYDERGPNSDPYDRYWFGSNGTTRSYYPMSTSSAQVTSTSPLEFLAAAATSTVSTDYTLLGESGLMNSVPQAVFRGAMTTAGNLTIPMNASTPFTAFIQYYFVELGETVNATDRSFFIDSPGASNLYRNNVVNSTGGALRAWIVRHNNTVVGPDSKIVMYPDPARTSLKGPMLSGLEVFKVDIPWVPPTNDRDYIGIESIKTAMVLTSWGGDPCQPKPHEWLTCNQFGGGTTEATVTEILLSGYNLSGAISPAFNKLLSITSLKLHNNTLTGPIPDLRALKNLTSLHLQNNKLTGALPDWLGSLPLQELFVQNNELSGDFPAEFLTKNWNFNYSGNPSLKPGSSSKTSSIGAIIGGVVGGLAVIITGLAIFCYYRGRKKKNIKEPLIEMPANVNPGGAREYSLAEVDAATEHYKREIGRGGFGPVYYGRLPDGKEVAVKVLDNASSQGELEFFNEVDILSRVHHKHLVSLVGYCRAEGKLMLIYEYIHKGSLRDHLDGDISKTGSKMLNWRTRLDIGLQAALGLNYLHTGCSPGLIHRDVKSNNILITSRNEAKVADFGVSRLVGEDDSTQVLTTVKGTAGYLDPEYYLTQYLSAKSDVYGFGVVLLELITGRRPIDRSAPNEANPNICDWVRSNLRNGDINAILDPKLQGSNAQPNEDALWKVVEVALQSVEPKSVHRPTMTQVVQELHNAIRLEGDGSQGIHLDAQFGLSSIGFPSPR